MYVRENPNYSKCNVLIILINMIISSDLNNGNKRKTPKNVKFVNYQTDVFHNYRVY